MNREEFLRQLNALLAGISAEEREDAIKFYRSYFEEAEQSDEEVIAELGSPQKVAESILKNLGMEGNYNHNAGSVKDKKTGSEWGGWAAVLLVLTSPFWLALLLATSFALLAVVITVFAVAVTAVALMVSLALIGFAMLGMGFRTVFSGMAVVGFGILGGGFLTLALWVLAVVLVVWVFGVFLPWALKGLWALCKKPFEKRRIR